MSHLFEETDPVMMHHYIDRLDAGIDTVRRADLCDWLHKVVDELDEARAERDAVIGICYSSIKDGKGNRFYRLDVDTLPGQEVDYDTEGEARAAVLAAAGFGATKEAPDAAERG